MDKKYERITTIKVFPNKYNTTGNVPYQNSKWKPFADNKPGDVFLSGDKNYSVKVFHNNHEGFDVVISEVIGHSKGTDSLAKDVKQQGLKKLAESLGDDIPF
jgi:hypothetical protein|tara:strand:+ start:221 stop:526 length:306 start_codon:yes stop_codon:yes gene_type:complete